MRQAFSKGLVAALLMVGVVVGVVGAGCGGKSARSEALNARENATNVQSAFLSASDDVKQQAGALVSAVQSDNPVAAYTQLESLSSKPALTPEQRQAVFEMQMALVRQLQADSAKGDAAAEELLNKYRASK